MHGTRFAWTALSAAILIALTGCFSLKRHGELPTASYVDIQQIYGTWYVQGAMTTLLDRNPSNATFTFTKNRDGSIRVEYEFVPGGKEEVKIHTAKIEVEDVNTNADWDIQFVWPFQNDYRVLHFDSETMLIGHPSRKYLYLLSRSKSLPRPKMEWLLDLAASRGFDVSYLVTVPQS